jgi:hypothetical protein
MSDNWDDYVGGYAIEAENRDELRANSTPASYLACGDLPVRMDPRGSALFQKGWLEALSQLQIGACQGNALAKTFEFCYGMVKGELLHFSRMFAYIGSQMEDGIRGDNGSTLSGGTKLAAKGVCPESVGPYPPSYPGWNYITLAMREAAKPFVMGSHTELQSVDEVKQYLGSGIGIVQIGIAWNNSMQPDSKGCIRSFRSGGGGHSVCYAGYATDDDVGVKSSAGYWFLLLNSWGKTWGVNGWAYVDPKVVEAQLRDQDSVFIGRSDLTTPGPRDVDWTKERVFG